MTSGRWIVLAILGITAVFAGAQWWFQTRAYYEPVALDALPVTLADGATITLPLTGAQAIDADTSPLRFRACLDVGPDVAARLLAQGTPAADATPLVAPDWFECFDAEAIGAALQAGEARAILSQVEVRPGADRIMAIHPDGRVFVWHQWNGRLEG